MTPCGPQGRHRGSSPGSLGDDPRVPRHTSALWPHGLHTRHHWKEIKWLRGPTITGGIVDREKRTKTSVGKAGGTRLCAQVDVVQTGTVESGPGTSSDLCDPGRGLASGLKRLLY